MQSYLRRYIETNEKYLALYSQMLTSEYKGDKYKIFSLLKGSGIQFEKKELL